MNTNQSIEATAQIAITLQAQEWNQVLSILAEAPYKLVAPLVEQITRQATEQAGQQAASRPAANGHDTTHPPN